MTPSRILLALLTVPLCGCTDDSPPGWRDLCVASHEETSIISYPVTSVAPNGGVTMTMTYLPVSNSVCDRTERQCYIGGRDYHGERTCKP